MKPVFPDLIIGATSVNVGVSNGVLMTLFADLTIARERGEHQQGETAFLYMHDERSGGDTMRWLSHFFDNQESFVAFVKFFGDERLGFVEAAFGGEGCAEENAEIIRKFAAERPGKKINVYYDVNRAFRLAAVNGAGMAVPFAVECASDVLADQMNDPQIRLRCAALHMRLGGNPAHKL